MPIPEAFARDLGYLDKFFDKLEAHGQGQPAPHGPALVEAVRHQRAEWAEIKGLLEGRTSAPSAAPVPRSAPAAPAPRAAAPQTAPTPPSPAAPVSGLAPAPRPVPAPLTPVSAPAPQPAPAAKPAGERPAFTVGSLYGR